MRDPLVRKLRTRLLKKEKLLPWNSLGREAIKWFESREVIASTGNGEG
jgi:hypothetical protein